MVDTGFFIRRESLDLVYNKKLNFENTYDVSVLYKYNRIKFYYNI